MRAHRLIGKDEKKYELCIGVRQGRNCVMLDKSNLKLHKTSFNELRFIFLSPTNSFRRWLCDSSDALSVTLSVCLSVSNPLISSEPGLRSLWNFTSVIFMSMGACVPIFRKIHKLLLPFAYYFCSNTVGPRNNRLAFKGSPSIKVNILRSQMTVSNMILILFKGEP